MPNRNQTQNRGNQGSNQQGSTRGFAAMDEETQREIARKGGEAVSGDRAHMSDIGRKGGESVSGDRDHMADIGRRAARPPAVAASVRVWVRARMAARDRTGVIPVAAAAQVLAIRKPIAAAAVPVREATVKSRAAAVQVHAMIVAAAIVPGARTIPEAPVLAGTKP